MALPALITGISLMCMEVMNELGTFALLNIPSISTGIAENWIIEGNPKSAIGLSLVALLIIFTLIIFEKLSRSKSKRWSENPASIDSQGWELNKTRAFLAIIIALFPPIFSFGIPCFLVLLNVDLIQKEIKMDLKITKTLVIPSKEIKWRFSRSSGPGGQNVNKIESRVEIIFNLEDSKVLNDYQKEILKRNLKNKL